MEFVIKDNIDVSLMEAKVDTNMEVNHNAKVEENLSTRIEVKRKYQ